jgi:hypothetical protein
VFEDGMLRRIFGSQIDDVTGSWRKLHKEWIHNVYSSSNVIRIMKSRWAVHTYSECGRREMPSKFWLESLKGRDYRKI